MKIGKVLHTLLTGVDLISARKFRISWSILMEIGTKDFNATPRRAVNTSFVKFGAKTSHYSLYSFYTSRSIRIKSEALVAMLFRYCEISRKSWKTNFYVGLVSDVMSALSKFGWTSVQQVGTWRNSEFPENQHRAGSTFPAGADRTNNTSLRIVTQYDNGSKERLITKDTICNTAVTETVFTVR